MVPQVRRDILQGWDVLVIDDEPDSLDVAARLLRHYGARVHTATNGKEGLEAIRTLRPRFVISDLSMPVMSGWDMIDQLQRARIEIPVIALTAHAMRGDRERAIAAGFHNHMAKPLSPLTFISDLLRLLEDIPDLAAQLQYSAH